MRPVAQQLGIQLDVAALQLQALCVCCDSLSQVELLAHFEASPEGVVALSLQVGVQAF